ncbi:MAG: pyridoxal phosphate-dependent aminotransferase [Sandaracinaceae bacterium]
MPRSLASRLSAIQPSATIAISDRAAALRAQGVDVLSFGLGEPDFPTPAHVRDAAKAAIDQGHTRYTRVRGVPALLTAIADDATRRRGVTFSPSEVVVSVGAKHSLFNLALALYEPGDEVIIPAPYWVSYPEQVMLVGATPRIVETREEDGFRLTPSALQAALGPRTKAVVLCTPSNPTGAAYDRASLEGLAEVLRGHDCWIVIDEIYGQLVYDGFEQVSLVTVAPDLRDRLVIVDGASKSYAMTGWRIGWMLGPPSLADAVEMVQSQATSNPSAIAQQAAIAALRGERAPIDAMVTEFAARRKLMVEGLDAVPGIRCRMPEGAFYAFPSVHGLLGKRHGDQVLADDMAVAAFLLEEARCAVVPGAAFGAPGYVRLSYAASQAQIREGVSRIAAAVKSLG